MTPRITPLVMLLCAGCSLVDQNTFNPEAGRVPVIPPRPVVAAPATLPPGQRPLLVVQPPTADRALDTAAIQRAVAAARARKPDVVFDVVTIASPQGDVSGTEAAAVARAIVAAGVPAQRVRLSARPETGASGREVRVFVR